MPPHKSVTDQIIENAMKSGEFSNLSGAGKPLRLDDDSNTPDHLRMAHKLLKDNDMAPAWISEGAELEREVERLLAALRRAAQIYRAGTSVAPEMAWASARQKFEDGAKRYNRKLLGFNLKLPPGVAHRAALAVEREIQRALDGPKP